MWNMPVICFGQVHWDGYVWICVCSTERQWVTRYRGPERKHLCEDVKPATSYSLRLSCVDVGGQSKVWEPKCINWFSRLIHKISLYSLCCILTHCVGCAVLRWLDGAHSYSAPWPLSTPKDHGWCQTQGADFAVGWGSYFFFWYPLFFLLLCLFKSQWNKQII